tara:strand:+ start:1060 stop:2853 length:1794 start_codon:yes stop_codon:yes gene_type:complete
MAKTKVPIKYTSREFDSIKSDLLDYARRYYPDTIKDFSEASFGSLMLDSVAYIGDVLSFYLDYQVNESFLDSAIEYDNVIRLARQMGYKFKGAASTSGIATFYAVVPANASGLGPNSDYLPILKRGTAVGSGRAGFILTEDVRFDHAANQQVAARFNSATGVPTHYAVRATGQIISGEFTTETISVGDYERFKRIRLSTPNVVEVVRVTDRSGNEYFEVEHLSQNVIFKDVANKKSSDKDNVPAILKPFVTPRRFVVEQRRRSTHLQFGYGSEAELASPEIADPSSVVLQRNAKAYVTDTTFDPTKLLGSDKLGIVPSNTELTVVLRANTTSNVNASVGSITTIVNPIVEFNDISKVPRSVRTEIIESMEVYNREPIVGAPVLPSIEEIRRRSLDTFASQGRAVTQEDYVSMCHAMPSKYGLVKRAAVYRDPDSLKRNLNLYILSESANGKLIKAPNSLKQNLKIWLNNVRMINDTIDILDAEVIDIGIEFHVVANAEFNRFDVLQECMTVLREKYRQPLYIGEPFFITDIYSVLNNLRSVADVENVKLSRMTGTNYSNTRVNIKNLTSSGGRYLKVPKNACVQIKYPRSDIKGFVR